MEIGQKVKNNRAFSGVPEGTEGYVVEDYGSGVTIAWDLPHRPYPHEFTYEQVAEMWAVDPTCPLRDGFDKETELEFLTLINEDA